MNYLAHFHLADSDNDGLLVGALLGDYIKGPLKGDWPASWEQGIHLHRQIDAFSDRHPLSRQFRQQLPPTFRRYSGIMLDVVCDHFLSRQWQQFHPQPITDFSQRIYQLFDSDTTIPASARQRIASFARHDVLSAYSDWRTIDTALAHIGERLRHDNPLRDAGKTLLSHYTGLEKLFTAFYPEVIDFADAVRRIAKCPERQRN